MPKFHFGDTIAHNQTILYQLKVIDVDLVQDIYQLEVINTTAGYLHIGCKYWETCNIIDAAYTLTGMSKAATPGVPAAQPTSQPAAPMLFNVGDVLFEISHTGYKVRVLNVNYTNRIYTLRVLSIDDPVQHPVGYIYDLPAHVVHQYFLLNTPVKSNKIPSVTKGTKVIIKDNGVSIPVGTVAIVSQVNADSVYIEWINPKLGLIQDIIYPGEYIIAPAEQAKVQDKCVCNSRDLFARGCKCGAVKPYKARMN